MRIRRKKHLDERLQAVGEYLIKSDRDIPNVLEAVKDKKYLDFHVLFGNDNPVCLEIGCGKGGFIIETALKNPNINYIAVEMIENIVVMACEKAMELNVPNVKFFNAACEYLPRYIKEEAISEIYLNFSPPYPQSPYENRRLTCDRFLQNYKSMLIDGGAVYQRTDDKNFFDYSLTRFIQNGFRVTDTTLMHAAGDEYVFTEYEKKFLAKGLPIYSLKACKEKG